MPKILFLLLFILSACSSGRQTFQTVEQLNNWSQMARFDELCDGLFTYQDQPYIINNILREFNRRNVSYMNCRQYSVRQ